jgi:hypothetical protein
VIARLFSLTARSPNTLLLLLRNPPGQGCWASLHQLSQVLLSARLLICLGKMPLTNFCSRLVVTRTRWIPNSQACDLRRLARRDLSSASAHART